MVSIGCVVSGPPEHGKARQTPPILFADRANPSPFEVLSVTDDETVDINVVIRSEDDGEPLQARLYLDYSLPDEQPQESATVKPGSLDDEEERIITMPWNVPTGKDGCHTLTLEVTHESNQFVLNPDDIATVTWWVNIGGGDALLNDCPKATGGTN